MPDLPQDFEEYGELAYRRRPKKRFKWRYLFYVAILFFVLYVGLTIRSGFSSDATLWENIVSASDRYLKTSFGLDTLTALAQDPKDVLIGMRDDRVNILLLGIGGAGHDGPNLTDTIIVASYKPSTQQVALLSIPRDLIIPIPGHGWRKINNLYAMAEANDPGTGGDYTKQIISQIFGLQIPYYMRVDFSGFRELVDLVGGVDVNVPNTLSDWQYPIPGKEDFPEDQRYEHLYIEAGQQHFDGATALKYVRSRHGEGAEGSDFARAARQQLVIDALTTKLVSFDTLIRPSRIKKIIDSVAAHVDTNMKLEDMAAFAKIAKDYKDNTNAPQPIQRVLDAGPDGPLSEANYNGAFVLEPKVDDFSELKFISANIFSPDKKFVRPVEDASGLPHVNLSHPTEATEKATIEIRNGTFVNGLARANQEKLEGLGYTVTDVSNSEKQDYDKTIIYDFSNGKFPQTLDFLAANYTDNITARIPLGLTSGADILIILGLDTAY